MRWILFGILLGLAITEGIALDFHESFNDFRFRNLSITDGLSNASVQDVVQDRFGFLWIGTRDGLNRYDGKTFQTFKHDPDDSTSIKSNMIMNVFQRSNGDLWISTDRGISIFDYKTQNFRNLKTREKEEPFCRSVVEDENNNLWIATHAGLLKFDGNSFQYFQEDSKNPNSIDHNTVLNIAVFEHQLFIGTMAGLNIFDLKKGNFQNGNNSQSPIFHTGDFFFKSICVTAEDQIWLGSFDDEKGGVVRRFTPETGQIDIFEPDSANSVSLNFNFAILDIFTDAQNRVWIGTNGAGLHLYDEQVNGFKKFEPNLQSQLTLNDPDIWSITQDKSGVLWIGTDGGGLFKSHKNYSRYFQVKTNPYSKNTLNANDVHSFEEDQNNLWIGTNVGGLNRYDKETGLYKSYNITEDKTLGLWDYTIYDLEIDNDGFVWIGTNTGGLSKMDPVNERFKHFRYDPENSATLSNNVVFCLEEDGNNLWIGTADGLNTINKITNVISRVDLKFNDTSTPKLVNAITRIGDYLWVGTGLGLLVKNLKSDKTERVYLLQDSTKHVEIHSLLSENDRLWIATDYGLARWKNGEVAWLTKGNGLVDNVVLDVTIGDDGQIWAQGRQHLISINPVAMQATSFFVNDNQFNYRSLFSGLNGQMFAGGINGFQRFYPNNLRKSKFQPEVYFTGLDKAGEGESVYQSLSGLSRIELGHNENHFSVHFLSTDLVNPVKNNFSYKINNEDWIDLGNSMNIPFVDLSPGEYTLEVRATNVDGVWSNNISVLSIAIDPPWWMTIWFRGLVLGLMIAGFYVFHKWRMMAMQAQKLKLENLVNHRTADLEKQKNLALKDKELIEVQAEQLAALDKVKSRFFANISHELRTPITLINGPVEAMINGEYGKIDDELLDGLSIVKHNGKSLLSLVNEILDLTKLEAGKLKLNKAPVLLHTFLSEIADAYRLQAKRKQIALEFDFQMAEELVLHIDEKRVKKIIDNLLSNAIKYTGDGKSIKLVAQEKDDHYLLKVVDTGLGIHEQDLGKIFDRFYQSDQPTTKAVGGTGIGLALAKELAKLTNGDLTVDSEFGTGSDFTYKFKADRLDSEQMEGLETTATEENLHLALEETTARYSSIFEIDKPRVLLVEDHPIMRVFARKILEPYFFIKEASDGVEGLQELSKGKFDMMISDVMMPHLDGFELLEKVKNDKVLKDISVIMLTARAEEEDKLFALTMGVDDYMLKPFSPNELLARAKNILQNRISRRDIPDKNGKELSADQKFLVDLKDIVEQNIDSGLLSVSYLAQQVAMSERQLLRRIKNSTGFSPNQFIREVRLQKAKNVLKNKQVYTVAEAAYAVGYEKVHYFSSQYAERFGKKPSEELKE